MSTVPLKSEFLRVAKIVLEREGAPMRPQTLVDHARTQGLFSDKISGLTLHQTMKSKLSVHIRHYGEHSPFVRTGPGLFFLRSLAVGKKTIYEAPPLRPPPPAENVLVFPTSRLDVLGRFQGIRTTWKRYLKSLLNEGSCSYMDRLDAEQDNDHKQILTYVLVRRGRQVLSFRRGAFNRIEDYLRGSLCIGFGGHTTVADRDLFSEDDLGLRNCAVRELFEELDLPKADARRLREGDGLEIVGLLNDDSSVTGRRHFAVVYEYQVAKPSDWERPRRGEKSITQLKWVSPSVEDVGLVNYEFWSQLCFRRILTKVVGEQRGHAVRRKSPFRGRHLLCVIGPIGCGKTRVTDALKADHGYAEVNSGRVVAELIGLPPVTEATRNAFQERAAVFISRPDGPRILGREIARRAAATGSSRVVVDGIRHEATLRSLVEEAKPAHVGVLFIFTPADLAFQFFTQRDAVSTTPLEFFALREAPVESEVNGLIRRADVVVYNWAGEVKLKRTLAQFADEVGL